MVIGVDSQTIHRFSHDTQGSHQTVGRQIGSTDEQSLEAYGRQDQANRMATMVNDAPLVGGFQNHFKFREPCLRVVAVHPKAPIRAGVNLAVQSGDAFDIGREDPIHKAEGAGPALLVATAPLAVNLGQKGRDVSQSDGF